MEYIYEYFLEMVECKFARNGLTNWKIFLSNILKNIIWHLFAGESHHVVKITVPYCPITSLCWEQNILIEPPPSESPHLSTENPHFSPAPQAFPHLFAELRHLSTASSHFSFEPPRLSTDFHHTSLLSHHISLVRLTSFSVEPSHLSTEPTHLLS